VEDVTPTSFTFATLRGHPLAGIVRFETSDTDDGAVRFCITVCARAASFTDWIAMYTVGRFLQDQNWSTTVRAVAELSGGSYGAVQQTSEICDDVTAAEIEREIVDLIAGRRRQEQSP
jgi:hypothetical protein